MTERACMTPYKFSPKNKLKKMLLHFFYPSLHSPFCQPPACPFTRIQVHITYYILRITYFRDVSECFAVQTKSERILLNSSPFVLTGDLKGILRSDLRTVLFRVSTNSWHPGRSRPEDVSPQGLPSLSESTPYTPLPWLTGHTCGHHPKCKHGRLQRYTCMQATLVYLLRLQQI